MTSLLNTWGATSWPTVTSAQPLGVAAPAPSSWDWALRLLGLAPSVDAGSAQAQLAATAIPTRQLDATRPVLVANAAAPLATAATPVATAPPASAPRATAPVEAAVQVDPASLPLRRVSASGAIRRSAIPAVSGGATSVTVARGMASYRQVTVNGGARGRTIAVPPARDAGPAKVEVFAVQAHRSGRHATQVLVPVSGNRVAVPAGSEVRFVVRVTGRTPGSAHVDAGVAKVATRVTAASVRPLPMLTWVNPSSASARGASVSAVERTLASFGVASTGASPGRAMPRRYVSAAWEAATKQPVGPVVERILADERALAASSPGATVWVQVSDEQDKTPAAAAKTAAWIARLDSELERRGSRAKLFVACQPRPHSMAYAKHIDGWAVTQSSAGMSRAQSVAAVRDASTRAGRKIELMEYPGNAFFDGGTPGGAALSTASAALDGAGAWFVYSANNLDVLESGRGVEGRGDIGGLVAIRRGSVLPTLALAEADYGANLGAAARATGGQARTGGAARAVTAAATGLDDYHHRGAPDLGAWERDIARALVARG